MKVSIITITHNRASLIGKTIQSVIDQTYPDFEHIIVMMVLQIILKK